jgi:DNA-binding MurR/RpiR family transcriptional regulator
VQDPPKIIDEAPGRDAQGLETRILGLLPSLTPAERGLAEQVLADPAGVARSTITALAERCRTSTTTVTRFCRALGLSGYAQLRLALAAETGSSRSWAWTAGLGTDIGPDDSMDVVLAHLVKADVQVIQETAHQLDLAVLASTVDALASARRIDIYAVSGSAALAADLRLRLHRIGYPAHVWSDVHDALTSAALLDERDVALGLSHSGETKEVTEPLQVAARNGATTVGVTNFPRSRLATLADLTLLTSGRELTFRTGGMSGRHAQMLVLDCLYIGLAQRDRVRVEQALELTADAVSTHRPSTDETEHQH